MITFNNEREASYTVLLYGQPSRQNQPLCRVLLSPNTILRNLKNVKQLNKMIAGQEEIKNNMAEEILKSALTVQVEGRLQAIKLIMEVIKQQIQDVQEQIRDMKEDFNDFKGDV